MPVKNEHEKLFNVHQAAEILNVSVKTIRRWAQKGYLPGRKVGPRGDWRFTKKQLNEMLKEDSNK